MYESDSFFSLTVAGQAGLVGVSAVLATLTIWGLVTCARRLPLVMRLPLALGLFWLFVWLSPQVYYLYFMVLTDALPLQNVVHSPPRLDNIAKLLGFVGKTSLAHHAQGLFGWLLILVSLVIRPTDWRK